MNLWKRILLILLAFTYLTTIALAQQPNIIFILADDMGWTDLSVSNTNQGHISDFYETPSLEQLAIEGISFDNAYTCGATCVPTRGGLLGGQYAVRPTNNLYAVRNLNNTMGQPVPLIGHTQSGRLTSEAITYAEQLKATGYTTAHFGKWHIGITPGNTSPQGQGFTFNFGGTGNGFPGQYHAENIDGVWQFAPQIGPELDIYAQPYTTENAANPILIGTPKHITDAMTEAVIGFIEQNKSNPFFVNWWQYAVHGPTDNQQARTDLLIKYQNKLPGTQHKISSYAALIEGLDYSIGQLLSYLNTTEDPRNPGHSLRDNTLIVFTSDNGGLDSTSDNFPLKEGKAWWYEGGIRVPLIASLPTTIAQNVVNHTPVTSIDMYPTFLDFADTSLPDNYIVDGSNIRDILVHNNEISDKPIFWHFPGYDLQAKNIRPLSILRKNNFKLIHNYEFAYDPNVPEFELYDVAENDVGETINLADSMPNIVKTMAFELSSWLWNTNAPLPTDKITLKSVDLPQQLAGDLNGDSLINFDDISGFILALTDHNQYFTQFSTIPEWRGDIDKNKQIDFDDINDFVDLLTNNQSNRYAIVPEPSTFLIIFHSILILFIIKNYHTIQQTKYI